eukprot:scaffold324430_cov51-Prasinocladus_malaysianus.AAC.1
MGGWLSGAEVAEVCAGAEHTLARTASGEVYSWGCSDNGRLGQGKGATLFYAFSRGQHILFLFNILAALSHIW